MVGNLGSLFVSLGLDAAQFTSGLTKAEYQAKKSLDNITSTVKSASAAIGVGLSATAFVGFIKSIIDAEDHLNDLSKATGIAVQTLGGLGFAAKQAGIDGDALAKAVGKLNLEIASALGGNEKALQVFSNLGISLKDLKSATPDQILSKVAEAFSETADGAIKAQYGAALFKKEYQAIIPLLDEGGKKLKENLDYYKAYSGVTAETAAKADKFNDTLVKLNLLSGAFGKTLVAELLTPLQHIADALVDAKEKGDLFKGFAQDVASILKAVASVAIFATNEISSLGEVLGARAAQANRLAHVDLAGVRAIGEELDRNIADRNARTKALINAINNPAETSGAYDPRLDTGAPKKTPTLKVIDSSGGAADDAAKKILEGQIRALESYVAREKEILNAREDFLRDSYAEGFLTINDYYRSVQEARDKELASILRYYDDAIAAEKDYQSKAGTAASREDAANKIAAFQEKQNAALRAAGYEEEKLSRMRYRDARQYKEQLDEIDAKLQDIAGNTQAAASIRFDNQFRNLLNVADPETKDRIAQLKAQEQAVLGLANAESAFSDTMQKVGIEQARIDLLVQTGAIGEIDSINKKAAIAEKYIGVLRQEVEVYQAIADAATGTARATALLNVERLKLAIDQLAASSDVLAKKFNDIFSSAIADGIVEIVNGTKSLKEAIKDVERQIVSSIARIAAQKVAEDIFSKGSAGGGIGDFFAKMFGGSGGFSSLFGGGFGTGAGFGSMDFGGFFASGGTPPMGKISVVGEHGPEYFIPKTRGTIVPESVIANKRMQRDITLNFYAPPGMNKETAHQAAVAMSRQLNIAQRINR